MKRREFLIAAAAAMAPLDARAQAAYPAKPINWVVGFPPGGGADGVTRLVASKVSQNIGQPVIVENRPGASSIIAAQYVAQAAPDGYTLFSCEQGSLIFNTARRPCAVRQRMTTDMLPFGRRLSSSRPQRSLRTSRRPVNSSSHDWTPSPKRLTRR